MSGIAECEALGREVNEILRRHMMALGVEATPKMKAFGEAMKALDASDEVKLEIQRKVGQDLDDITEELIKVFEDADIDI